MENSQQTKPKSQMPKIIIFQLCQNNFASVGISPRLMEQQYPLNNEILLGFSTVLLSFICNLMFTIREAKTFAEYIQSIYMCSLVALIIFALVIILLNVTKMFNLRDRVENFANTTLKYTTLREIFNETNRLADKLSEIIFFVMIKLTPVCFIMPWTFYTYFIFFTTDLGSDAFELPTPLWFPFDWRNPFGYFIAVIIYYIMIWYELMIGACVICFAVECYLHGIAGSKTIKGSLFSFNQSIGAKIDQKLMLDKLIEFIDLHSTIKHLITDFSDIFEGFITILFMWSLVSVCGALLMIQIQIVSYICNHVLFILLHHSDDLLVLLITTLQISYAFGVMLISCELGQRINLAFNECSEIINQFDWYLLPAEIQRMLPIIINYAQQPVDIKCFGSAACDRETFKYVIRTAYSYFTVLRKFYK